MDRIFNRFKPHDTLRIVDVDHRRDLLTGISANDGTTRRLSFGGIGAVSHSSLVEGRAVEVQYGRTTRDQARYSQWRLRTGDECISALRHPYLRINRLALGAMLWLMPRDDLRTHLVHFAEGCSTLQENAETWIDDKRIGFSMRGGTLNLETALKGRSGRHGSIEYDGVVIPDALPQTIRQMLPGHPLSAAIGHPAFIDPMIIIGDVVPVGDGTRISIATTGREIDMDEALHIVNCGEAALAA